MADPGKSPGLNRPETGAPRREAPAIHPRIKNTYLRPSGRPGSFRPGEGGVPPGFLEGAEGLCMAGDFCGLPGRDGVTCLS